PTPMKLRLKFVLLIVGVVALTLGATAWVVVRHQQAALEREVVERSQLVLSFGEACRDYARETLSPAVRKEARSLIFEPDSATFAARGTFEAFNKRKPAYTSREASLNPLNPANRADAQEEELIRLFQDNPDLKEHQGFRHKNG